MTIKTINIKRIRIDGGTQSRIEIDNAVVAEYAARMRDGEMFPPMVVFHDGADYWLADGFHRWHAYNTVGKASAEIDLREGTLRDAERFSFGANKGHGLRQSNADKRKSVLRMLSDYEWSQISDKKIAAEIGVSQPFVSSLRNPKIPMKVGGAITVIAPPTDEDGGDTHPAANLPRKSPAPEPEVAQPAPEEKYTELDAAYDQVEALQAALAVASLGNTPESDKALATDLIGELRAENKTLRASLKAVTVSRDLLMNELAQVKRQCISQQAELKRAKAALV